MHRAEPQRATNRALQPHRGGVRGRVLVRPLSAGVRGTAETLEAMSALVRRDFDNPELRHFAARLVRNAPGHDFDAEARALFEFVQKKIRYQRDPITTEVVQGSPATLALGYGDCDDKSVLLATLLASIGHLPVFAIASNDGREWSHVWVRALINGKWIDFDPTSETAPSGWHTKADAYGVYPIFPSEMGGLGFDPTGVIGAGVSVIGSVVGQITQNQRTRQLDERFRDSWLAETLAQLRYLKEDLEADRIAPLQAERQADTLARNYLATLFASVTTESVRRSVGNKDPRTGKSQQDQVNEAAEAIKTLAKTKAAAQPARSGSSGTSSNSGGGTAASGGIEIPGFGQVSPTTLALVGIGLVLLLRR